MKTEELFEYADKYNREEIAKFNYDIEPLYELSLEEGKKLSEQYEVDEIVVLISLALMDSKLPEAVCLGTPKEHVKMSLEATKKILELCDIDTERKTNILKCVEEHHGKEKYYSKESEVVANADCYKFLSPKGILMYVSILGRRLNNFEEEWKQLEKKMDEKIKNVSLGKAKDELQPSYENFKKYLQACYKN